MVRNYFAQKTTRNMEAYSMTYTINGKPYTEFDINKRCAEIMGINWQVCNDDENAIYDIKTYDVFEPTECEVDTWPIIEKIWDELMSKSDVWPDIKWEFLISKHNCTKLVAACICLIEVNGGEL